MSKGSTSLNYPISIDQFAEWQDDIDHGIADAANDMQAAILNTQAELGINPSGVYDNISLRFSHDVAEITNIMNNVYDPWQDLGTYLAPRNYKGLNLIGAGVRELLKVIQTSGSHAALDIENFSTGLSTSIIQQVNSDCVEINKTSSGIGNAVTLINAGSGNSLTINQDGDGTALKISKNSGAANIIEIVNIGTGHTLVVDGSLADSLFGGVISDADNLHTHGIMGTLKSNGTVKLTANWDVGDHKITAKNFESNVASGTAPLVVSSNTKVDNLNVSYLDSKDSLSIVRTDATSPLTANWDVGSKQITAKNFESAVSVGTAPLQVSSTTRVDNLNSQYLGGKEISDIDYALLSANDASTDVTAAELELLTAGPFSIADSLHIHTIASYEIVRANVLMIRPEENIPANNVLRLTLGRYIDAANIPKDKTSYFTTAVFSPVTGVGVERYDLVGMDFLNQPVIVQGSEVASPGNPYLDSPAIPDPLVPIAIVKVDETGTVVVNASDITDIRPFLNPGDVGNIKVNGSKVLTADWDAGSPKIKSKQFESDIITGVSPFVVSSNTRIANLNADYLDGNDISGIDYALLTANDPFTDVSAAELEQLRNGSNADILHTHTNIAPAGTITFWSGTIATIPSGWVLCDGTGPTQDLTDQFILCVANSLEDPGATGGSHTKVLAITDLPAHTHAGTTSTNGDHGHTGSSSTNGDHNHSGSTDSEANHTHSIGNQGSKNGGVVLATTQPAVAMTSSGSTGSGGGHSHSITVNSDGDHSHTISLNNNGNHSHTITTSSVGSGNSIENRPAFYKLALIMKT